LDHLAFFEGGLTKREEAITKRIRELRRDFNAGGRKSESPELAAADTEALEFYSGYRPLIEAAALVFDHVPEDGWEAYRADPREVSQRIRLSFLENYVDNTLTEANDRNSIAITLVSKKYGEGRMNDETSEFIRSRTGGTRKSMSYKATAPGEINLDIAAEILYRELPHWQQRYHMGAVRATDALATAYSQDPSRLKRAYIGAETVDDFIEICRSGCISG
jgi:hypothetical protein